MDATYADFITQTSADLKLFDAEIRKLWDLSNKRNRKSKTKKMTEKINQKFPKIITCNNLSDVTNPIITDFHSPNHFIISNNAVKQKVITHFQTNNYLKAFSGIAFDNTWLKKYKLQKLAKKEKREKTSLFTGKASLKQPILKDKYYPTKLSEMATQQLLKNIKKK